MNTYYGVVAEFKSTSDLHDAAEKIIAEGYTKVDVHTPFPVHGLDRVLKQGPSHVGWIVVAGGTIGILGGQLMMWWMNGVDYPLWVSGKEPYAWQSTIPVTFECMVLLAAFGAVFGMLGLNKLPRLSHPIFKHSTIHRASDDRFFMSIEADDPRFDQEATVQFLAGIGGENVELVED